MKFLKTTILLLFLSPLAQADSYDNTIKTLTQISCKFVEQEELEIDGHCPVEMGLDWYQGGIFTLSAWLAGGDCLIYINIEDKGLLITNSWIECAD